MTPTTLTPDELSKRTYKACIVDADSLLYKAAALGSTKQYQIIDSDFNVISVHEKKKDAVSEIEMMSIFGDYEEDYLKSLQIVVNEVESPVEKCYEVLDFLMSSIKQKVKACKYIFCIGRGKTFREDIARIKVYKGNRDAMVRPEHLDAVKNYMSHKTEVRVIKDVETDDCVSWNICRDFYNNPNDPQVVLAYIDKDLLNSMGCLFNYNTNEWRYNQEHEANYNFFMQCLKGDSTDNIQGLPKIGPKKALQILEPYYGSDFKTLYSVVLEAYRAYYGDTVVFKAHDNETLCRTAEEMLDENAELLWMLRSKDEHWKEYKEKALC